MAGPGKPISTTTCWPVVESRRETSFSHIQCNPDSPSGGVAHGSIVGGGAPHSGRCVVVGPSPIAGDELDGGRGRAHSEWTQTEPTPTTKLRPMPAATLVAPTPISPTSSPASPIPTATIPLPDADNWHLAVVADPRSLMHASFCASPRSCRSGRPRSPLQPSPSECMHGSYGRTASRIWCQLPRCVLVTLPRFLNEHPRRSVSTTLVLDIDPCTTTATPTDHHLVDVSNPVLLEGFATGIGASTPYTT